MDYAHLFRQAIARLEANPSLLGDEARQILAEWMGWSADAFESGDQARRAIDDPEIQPGVKLARLLVGHAGHS
ncbi:MAG TPA: hypothetical protein VFR23_00940 [Jiangellaceae bacterium]|nr:hypothetical protein [Jiangellaceae bacterium]